jgi:hypothetical protein
MEVKEITQLEVVDEDKPEAGPLKETGLLHDNLEPVREQTKPVECASSIGNPLSPEDVGKPKQ